MRTEFSLAILLLGEDGVHTTPHPQIHPWECPRLCFDEQVKGRGFRVVLKSPKGNCFSPWGPICVSHFCVPLRVEIIAVK